MMHYLYKITNQINGKNYIGQTNDLKRRWRAHKNAALNNKPEQIIHYALIKYGIDNFKFEHIATCQIWDDANELETLLVTQYDCHISANKGYNSTRGGFNAPKTEKFRQMLRDWHASLSPEEKDKRNKILSAATFNQIATQGHPSQDKPRTEEQKARMSAAQLALDKEAIYTAEVRQRMSEAHLGTKDSEETKQKKADSAKEAWEKRIDYSRKCEASGCEISGKVKYKIINGIRYCNKHGLRMLRYSRTDCLAP
jgi:group I intron endonuclease